VVVDPQGSVLPANTVPFKVEGAYTDPPTNVVPGGADLNGRICGFADNTNLRYFFEYSKDCSMNTGVTKTPSQNVTATGSCNQTVPPARRLKRVSELVAQVGKRARDQLPAL